MTRMNILLIIIMLSVILFNLSNAMIKKLDEYYMLRAEQKYAALKEPEILEKIKLLKAIALCESGGNPHARSHTDDHGLFQLNIKHELKAKKLGLDIHKPLDNFLYALYLLETKGTAPWQASKKCWQSGINKN